MTRTCAARSALWMMLAIALPGGVAVARPGQPVDKAQAREPGEKAESRQEMPAEPVLAKKFLERRLEETTKREEHLRVLLARLEKGEAPAEVGKDLEPGRQGGRDAMRRGGDQGAERSAHSDRPARGKLQPEEREHILKFLRDNSPELSARFDKLIKSEPETADRIIGHMSGRVRDAEQAKEANPGLFTLRVKEMEGGAALVDAMKAFREAKAATPQDPARLVQATQQLRVAMARQFDLRLSLQENEIEGLTKRLGDLKADLEKKRATREEAIDAMLSKVRDGKDVREGPPREGGPARDGERRPENRQPAPGAPPGR